VRRRFRLTFDEKRGLPIVAAEGQTRGHTRGLDPGQSAELIQQLLVERDLLLFLRVFPFGQVEPETQDPFG